MMLSSALVTCLEMESEDAIHYGSLSERTRLYGYAQTQFRGATRNNLRRNKYYRGAKPHLKSLDEKVYSKLENVHPDILRKFLKWSWDEKFIYGAFMMELINFANN